MERQRHIVRGEGGGTGRGRNGDKGEGEGEDQARGSVIVSVSVSVSIIWGHVGSAGTNVVPGKYIPQEITGNRFREYAKKQRMKKIGINVYDTVNG